MRTRQAFYAILLLPFLALTVHVLIEHGLIGFYREALGSSATILMGLDLVIGLGLILAWMVHDARRTRTPVWPYVAVTLAIGVAGPLGYMIHREARLAAGGGAEGSSVSGGRSEAVIGRGL